MLDFSKIYCNLHPQELITNFCNKDQCLVGLCASCICTHTQSHVQKGTSPDYQNIRSTFKKAQQSVRTQVQLFQKDKQRIDNVVSKVLQKRVIAREIINQAKQQVSVLLGDYFEQKQKNMIRQIQSEQKKYGLHCENRLQGLNSYIARQVSNLISAAQELSSNNFLESLPRIRTQYLVNSSKLHKQLQVQIQKNERFSTSITCQVGLLQNLITVLDQAIRTQSNLSSLQNTAKDSGYYPRPKSQAKQFKNVFSSQIQQNSYPTRSSNQRNSQSQLNIYQSPTQNYYQKPINMNNNLIPQPSPAYKNNYLEQIPKPIADLRNRIQNNIPKVSIMSQNNQFLMHGNNYQGNQNQRMQNPPPATQYMNQPYMNLQQNIAFPTRQSQAPNPTPPPPQIYSRSVQKPQSRQSQPQVFHQYPNFNPNLLSPPANIPSMLYDRDNKSTPSTLAKKTKRSGLKLSNINQIESDFGGNVENQRPRTKVGNFY